MNVQQLKDQLLNGVRIGSHTEYIHFVDDSYIWHVRGLRDIKLSYVEALEVATMLLTEQIKLEEVSQ
jgi:hypothetical protein